MEDVHFFYQKANRCYQLAWQAFDLRVAQRLNLLLRGHLAEFGVIAPQGLRNVGKLIAIVRDEGDARLPDLARQTSPGRDIQARQPIFAPASDQRRQR